MGVGASHQKGGPSFGEQFVGVQVHTVYNILRADGKSWT